VCVVFIVGTTMFGAVIFAQENTLSGKSAKPASGDIIKEMEALRSPDARGHASAICSLREKHKVATEAIPYLIQLIGDETAVDTCGGNGEPTEPAPVGVARSSIGREAAKTLAAIGKTAVDPVIMATTDSNWKVRNNAVWALGEVRASYAKGQEPRTMPLMTSLRDDRVEIRRAAAWALAEIKDTQAVAALITSLDDPDSGVRKNSAWALGEMKSDNSVQPLILKLQDPNWEVRKNSAWALGEIRNREATVSLTAALNDSQEEVRNAAAFALRELRRRTEK
jgi:HEAT repeat protein